MRQEPRGAGHRWLEVEVARNGAPPAPGQFVQILLGASSSAAFLPRPMSVASCRAAARGLVLGFLYEPVGVGTHALAALAPGAAVEVLGPLGRGFPLETPGTPVLVAGGRGVAPMLFAAERLARARRRCLFVFGARDRSRLVGLPEARRLLAKLGGRLHLATDDGSLGWRGDVVTLLDHVAGGEAGAGTRASEWVIHACGPHAMLAAVARWALARHRPAHLAMESIMACGTGVCRGCPLPRSARAKAAFDPGATPSLWGNREWAMCCTEGPVFAAAALDWEHVEA